MYRECNRLRPDLMKIARQAATDLHITRDIEDAEDRSRLFTYILGKCNLPPPRNKKEIRLHVKTRRSNPIITGTAQDKQEGLEFLRRDHKTPPIPKVIQQLDEVVDVEYEKYKILEAAYERMYRANNYGQQYQNVVQYEDVVELSDEEEPYEVVEETIVEFDMEESTTVSDQEVEVLEPEHDLGEEGNEDEEGDEEPEQDIQLIAYQEMIAFLPLCCHPNPKKVLIVGGEGGGVAREVFKHPLVEEVHQVKIEEVVTELAQMHSTQDSDHPYVNQETGDGFDFIKRHRGQFDVIITDSSEAMGPGVSLFQEPFYQLMKAALRGNGIVCSQGGSYWSDLQLVKDTLCNCMEHFPVANYAQTSIPSHPCGQIGFVIGSLNEDANLSEPEKQFTKADIEALEMFYYTTDIHRAAFALPPFIEKELYK